jgi:hypothetical protein
MRQLAQLDSNQETPPFEILFSDLGTAVRLPVGWTSQPERCNFVAL